MLLQLQTIQCFFQTLFDFYLMAVKNQYQVQGKELSAGVLCRKM